MSSKKETNSALGFPADSTKDNKDQPKIFGGFWDLFTFALAIKASVFSVVWHYGLVVGFWEYILSYGIMVVGYLMLILSLMEMISMVTFPGGYYGYARCALGSTLGYIVGCSAVLENIFFVSSAILRISQSFLYVFQIPKDFAYLCWFAVYFMIITIHARHKYLFWRMMHILTVLSYSLFLIYLLGTSQYLNFDKYAYQSHAPDQFFEGGFLMWFENFRLPSIFFFGIDMIICVSDQVHDPRNNICKAMISCFLCMVVFSIWFIVTLSSQAPGLTKDLFNPAYPFPLGYGLGRLFNISMQSSALYAILPLFSSVLTTIFVCSKQINSIANSGMFPSLFKTKAQGNSLLDPQILAMIFAGVIGCVGNTVAWNYDLTMTLRLILLSGFVVYIAMLLCYIVFAHKYGHIDRSFRSPFGSIGAVLGIIIFVFALASLLYSQKNNYAVYIYVSCMVLMFVYYIIFGEANQVFSSMEIQYFFRLYVVNANVRRKSTFQNPNLNDRSLWSRLFHKKNGSDRKIHCDSNIIVSPKSQKGVGGTPLPTSAETTEVVEFSRPKARSKFFDLEKGKPNRADSEETVSVSLRPRLPADGQSDVLCDLEDISETHRAI